MKLTTITVGLAGLLFLLMVTTVACGDDKDGEAPGAGAPAQSLPQAEEEQLRQTVVEAQRTFLTGEAEEAYSFYSSDYQAKCPFENFSRILMLALALFSPSEEPEITVGAIRLEGEKAFVDILVNGQDISAGTRPPAYPYYWIREGDEWKRTSDNPSPCLFPIVTPVAPQE